MCAIIGALVTDNSNTAKKILQHIWLKSHERGRDGRGYMYLGFLPDGSRDFVKKRDCTRSDGEPLSFPPEITLRTFVGNLRAEPTTEYVQNKHTHDQQPYTLAGWSIVHNGTIANDKDLRTNMHLSGIDSAVIVERLEKYENTLLMDSWSMFKQTIADLTGSFAILASKHSNNRVIYAAANYRPIWYLNVPLVGVFFASARHYFPDGFGVPEMLSPYTMAQFHADNRNRIEIITEPILKVPPNNKALVICSGGLDSVVAATWAIKQGMDVSLIHFSYGSRAGHPEAKAIAAIADELGIKDVFSQPIDIYRTCDSPLLDKFSPIAGGEKGAEFAYEWVPARNLLMLSMATAIAEARGIQTLILGNNLEEAGAYPDNEPEFIAKFNDLLPFAIGDGKRMQVLMPVGNLMKHEIVALGHELGAPLHLTWSCYRAGHRHCGKCGPCYMRRTAFQINNLPEVIDYEA